MFHILTVELTNFVYGIKICESQDFLQSFLKLKKKILFDLIFMLENVAKEYYYGDNYNYGYDNDDVDDYGDDNYNDNDDYYYSPTAQVVPSWNVTITYKTTSSLTVRWSTFPLNVPIQRFLVKYKEKNSNVSLIYHVSNWYNSHYTGNTLKGYTFYEVNVVAETSGNGTLYSSEAITARTHEGGKYAKTIKQTNKQMSTK